MIEAGSRPESIAISSDRVRAAATTTPRERVAGMIREALRSAEVTDLIEPADPAPPHPEFDADPRFYTALKVVQPTRPFAPERPGEPTFRDVVLEGIRQVRKLLADGKLGPRDCKAYLLQDYEAGAAIVYARIEGFVLAVLATCDYEDGVEQLVPGAYWDLIVAVNVDDEAIDARTQERPSHTSSL
jgi:hypothetical protein